MTLASYDRLDRVLAAAHALGIPTLDHLETARRIAERLRIPVEQVRRTMWGLNRDEATEARIAKVLRKDRLELFGPDETTKGAR